MIPSARHPQYSINFSNEDREWVATSSEFPSLSWLASTPSEALAGLDRLIREVQKDLAVERSEQQAIAEERYYQQQARRAQR